MAKFTIANKGESSKDASPIDQSLVEKGGYDQNCAWCLAEHGVKSLRNTHGICDPHKQAVIDEAKRGDWR